MIDLARPSRWKPAASGLFDMLMGLSALAVALIAVPMFVKEEIVEKEGGSWAMLLMGTMPLCLGWGFLSAGQRTLRARFGGKLHVRAGAEGVSVRVPGPARANALFMNCDVEEKVFDWDEIVNFYEQTSTVNGIPMSRRVVLATKRGDVEIEGVYYADGPAAIIEGLRAARPGRSRRE